jgi:hypothetical protein
MDRVEHDLSDEHWTALKAEWGVCAYCGATDQPLQRDCVLALSHGGGYTLDNIAGLRLLQRSACNDEVTGWLRRKRFDERAFLVHHLEITTALALRFPAVSDVETETRQTTGVSPLDPGPAGLRTRRTCTSPRARNVTRGGSGPSSRGRTRLYQSTTNRGS